MSAVSEIERLCAELEDLETTIDAMEAHGDQLETRIEALQSTYSEER